MSHVWWEFVRSLERDRYEIDSWVDGFRRGETIMTSVAVKPPCCTVARNNQYRGCHDFDDICTYIHTYIENIMILIFGESPEIEIVAILVVVLMVKICAIKVMTCQAPL